MPTTVRSLPPRAIPRPIPTPVPAPSTRTAAPIRDKYDADKNGRITHAEVLAKGGYAQLEADLAASLPKEPWAAARSLNGLIDDTVRYYYLARAGSPKLLSLIGETRAGVWKATVGPKALELKRALAALGPTGAAVALGFLDGPQRRVLRDLDFVSYDAKSDAWSYQDPLVEAAALAPASALEQLPTHDSPANPSYSASGELYTSMQSGGRNQPSPQFHIGKLNPATGKVEPFPSAEYQKTLGGVLGMKVIPKPGGGGGELLVALDWKKSRFIAIDLATKQEVFNRELPNAFVQQLLPFTTGSASFHNDFAAVFDSNPDGTFFITNPPRGSIGVFQPDWKNPDSSKFTEVLKGDASTAAGDTDLSVGGRRMKLEAFKLFGHDVELPFQSGVDSITYTPDLEGKGPHLLISPLTPDGAARLWALPANVGDATDVKAAVERASKAGLIRPVARVPMNDGLTVVTLKGRQYLFGSDVQGSGAFVMSLDTLKAAPLVKDPRIGWADGMTVRVDDATGRLRATFSNSGLGSSLGGDVPPVADRGLYSVELSIDELVARLDALPAPRYNDEL